MRYFKINCSALNLRCGRFLRVYSIIANQVRSGTYIQPTIGGGTAEAAWA